MKMNRLPVLQAKHRICIICEGNEEYRYLLRLIELKIWDSQYAITLDNAKGCGNIPARYQDRIQNGFFDAVLIFCDTDKKPYEQYHDIKRKINEFHGIENVSEDIIVFGNPCTMQIILLHWGDIKLKTQAKKINAPFIEEFTGIIEYKAKESQLDELIKKITADNYFEMRNRIESFSHDDNILGSTNFNMLLNRLESSDDNWIDKLNKKLQL